MSSKILITGAAGYIGGSLLADFLSNEKLSIAKNEVVAAVRSPEQADAISKLGIPIFQLDLSNEGAVTQTIIENHINTVIHTTSCIDPTAALHLINALGKQRVIRREETYFIHTSGISAFYEATGWPSGQLKDTDAVFKTEKELRHSYAIRNTDISVIEVAAEQGVTNFVVIPSLVYGQGTGQWNKLSLVLPAYVLSSLSKKKVYKFPKNTKLSAVHISDLTALYGQIIGKIREGEIPPSGEQGYYFAQAHDLHIGEVLDHLALALKSRGLVTDPTASIFPNDEVAAESLGVPEAFVQTLWNSGDNMVAEVPFRIGWSPAWNKGRFFENIDDEIDAVLELGKAKSSLIDSLFDAARG